MTDTPQIIKLDNQELKLNTDVLRSMVLQAGGTVSGISIESLNQPPLSNS